MPAKKKTASKSATAKKKPTTKKRTASRGKSVAMAKMDTSPMPAPPEPSMPGPQGGVDACSNCDHMPMRVNTVMGILVAIIFILSVVVFASVMTISSQAFQIDAFNSGATVADSVAKR